MDSLKNVKKDKMMKKILLLIILLGLTSCGSDERPAKTSEGGVRMPVLKKVVLKLLLVKLRCPELLMREAIVSLFVRMRKRKTAQNLMK